MIRALVVADNEFRSTMKNPLVLVSIVLLIVVSAVSSYGSAVNTFNYYQGSQTMSMLSMFMTSMGENIYEISCLFVILSVCLGVFSISEERYGGTLGVLIGKPLCRRDVVLGKFIGLSAFLLIAMTLVFAIHASAALIVYPMPAGSFIEIFARMVSVIVSLFLSCIVMMGLSMMIGTLFRNIALVITLAASIVYLQWFTPVITLFGLLDLGFINLGIIGSLDSKILYLYFILMGQNTNFIFTASTPYLAWLSNAFPYMILLAFEAIIIILIDCMLFNRVEA